MQLSIVIVNYNTFTLTSNCIRSIKDNCEGISYEIILVDNASTECDPHDFLEVFPFINLIASKENLGFAKGNNLGIEKTNGDYILLLNSDCELMNNAPKICYDYMLQHPECGMTTAQLQYPDGRLQYNCRRFRSITWELLEVIPLYLLLPKKKREERMLHHYFDHSRQVNCDWVWGAFMLFPRSILERLPGNKLAEDFFMYCEDTLWCWQVKQLGLEITFLPDAKVMHVHKGSSSTNISGFRKMSNQNHLIFMKRIYSGWKLTLFSIIYLSKQRLIQFLT